MADLPKTFVQQEELTAAAKRSGDLGVIWRKCLPFGHLWSILVNGYDPFAKDLRLKRNTVEQLWIFMLKQNTVM